MSCAPAPPYLSHTYGTGSLDSHVALAAAGDDQDPVWMPNCANLFALSTPPPPPPTASPWIRDLPALFYSFWVSAGERPQDFTEWDSLNVKPVSTGTGMDAAGAQCCSGTPIHRQPSNPTPPLHTMERTWQQPGTYTGTGEAMKAVGQARLELSGVSPLTICGPPTHAESLQWDSSLSAEQKGHVVGMSWAWGLDPPAHVSVSYPYGTLVERVILVASYRGEPHETRFEKVHLLRLTFPRNGPRNHIMRMRKANTSNAFVSSFALLIVFLQAQHGAIAVTCFKTIMQRVTGCLFKYQ